MRHQGDTWQNTFDLRDVFDTRLTRMVSKHAQPQLPDSSTTMKKFNTYSLLRMRTTSTAFNSINTQRMTCNEHLRATH